eukprot:8627543-Ditylum_brightwellii.AAC.1
MTSSIHPEYLYIEEVSGLSSAGAVDVSVKIIGYIVFVRGGKNNTSNNNDNIDATGKINEDSDDEDDDDMPDLIYTNEELMQLASDIGIAFNKQCAKRSTCEQGADVREMFKLIKMYAMKSKLFDLPPSHIYRHVKNCLIYWKITGPSSLIQGRGSY